MSIIKVEEVNNSTEELIIAGMISSTSYLAWIKDKFNPQFIQNDQIKLLTDLILEHFELHGVAPKENIKELFASIEDHIDKEDITITKRLLKKISNAYGEREISFEILSDTTTEYFDVRSVEVLIDKISGMSKRGKVEDAISSIHEWVDDPKGTQTGAISPFDHSFAEAIMAVDLPLFRFGTDLDRIMPKQVKNKLYTFLGGTKSGKSQWLGWLGSVGLENGMKVLIWEYELTQIEFLHRMLSVITGKGIKLSLDNTEVTTGLSIFDCEKNRDGTCENINKPEQTTEPNFAVYEDEWIPCSYCRGTDLFVPVIWKEEYIKPLINTVSALKKEQTRWNRQNGDNIRIFNRDPGTQTISDLKNELNRLRVSENFVPDMLIIDAADNIKPSKIYKDKRHELNNVWSELSILAKHGYLVWTASQTNRTGWNKEWITTEMIGEDASKLMICDGTILINQYKDENTDEYFWNTQRLRAAYFRGQKLPSQDVKVIHDFSRYIACLDCLVYTKKKKEKKEKKKS